MPAGPLPTWEISIRDASSASFMGQYTILVSTSVRASHPPPAGLVGGKIEALDGVNALI
jgi:hypothetical protein